MPILTDVPSLPRMRPMVSASVVVFTGTPSMVAITSPERIPRLGRRRAVERRDHHDLAVLHRHLDADAGVLARARDLDVVVLVAVEIRRIGIERGHHAANGGLQQLMIVDRVRRTRARPAPALRRAGARPARARPARGGGLVRQHAAREPSDRPITMPAARASQLRDFVAHRAAAYVRRALRRQLQAPLRRAANTACH